MARYRKEDVQIHNDGRIRGPQYPAVNVKCYDFARGLDIAERFKCSEAVADKAEQFAFDAACEGFWEDAKFSASERFGSRAKVFSAGRSGGWLIVDGIGHPDDWDAVALARWRGFERDCRRVMEHYARADSVAEMIEANRWAEAGAEAYNFIDTAAGETRCVVDLNKALADTRRTFLGTV